MSAKKTRLDQRTAELQLVLSRSQAESYIRIGKVLVNGKPVTKPGFFVAVSDTIELSQDQQYVSRAALKLESVARELNLSFKDKVVLDVGSSTGGFTDYALKHGAKKVIAVDVGTDQLHPSLRSDERVELHEKTDIRDINVLSTLPDVVVMDVSFISLRHILPHVKKLVSRDTLLVAMCKPQFEAGAHQTSKGIIKNSAQRRAILKEFEDWLKSSFLLIDKADSQVAGAGGNLERFYLLKKLS